GVLFLDELAEFQRPVLEVLRQPLEEREIQITRTHGKYTFPANFMLVAAMNPCPCGNYPDLGKCNCTSSEIQRYLGKISQPFLDRMDICVETPKIRYEELNSRKRQESSEEIRKRVCYVRKIQKKRYQGTQLSTNAMLGVKMLDEYCYLGRKEKILMEEAFSALGLTARTYHKILKVARTIADMEESEMIKEQHLKEAIGYRTMDKKFWGR
ncbi:MAG: ATP-binding protein, partial [Dorea sp.]